MAKTTVPIELSSTPSIVDNGTATAITIDSSQNVGIGTSPTSVLDVAGTTPTLTIKDTQNKSWTSSDTTLGELAFRTSDTSGIGEHNVAFVRAVNEVVSSTTPSGALSFGISASNANASEAMRIDSSGNVGIGVSPSYKLHVSGTQGSNIIRVHDTGNTVGMGLGATSTGAEINWGGIDVLKFVNVSTEHMRISASGFTKMTNNNGDYYSAGGSYHEMRSNTNGSNNAVMSHNGTSPYGPYIVFTGATPDDNVQYFLACGDSTTTRVIIYSDGDIQNHDNSYGSLSDEKLKQDITDAGSQWDDIKNLRVRNFKFKSDVEAYGDDAKTLIGLVAQEAELVTPHLVKDNPDLDEEHNDLGTVTKSIKYSVLYMKAIKALQEAMTRIEDLESRIQTLEGN